MISSSTYVPHDPERVAKLRTRSSSIERLAGIFLEYYHCEGPVHLLGTVKSFYQHLLNLLVVLHRLDETLNASIALAGLGDVFFAEYELKYDLVSLENSIAHYERALSCSSLPQRESCDLQVRLACALHHRFEAVSSYDDCRRAMDLLDRSQVGMSTNNDSVGQAWALTVHSLLQCSASTWSVLPLPAAGATAIWHEMLNDLESSERARLPRSRYILSLLAEVKLRHAIVFMDLKQDCLNGGWQALNSAMRLCNETAQVPYWHILISLFHFNHLIFQYGWDNPTRTHLSTAIKIAESILISPLAKSNPHVYWSTLQRWAIVAGAWANVIEDVDVMEQVVCALKEATALCPQSHIRRVTLANRLADALCQYFYQSSRVSVLDEIIALQGIGIEHILCKSHFTTSIVQALISRAQVADVRKAKALVHQALYLCRSLEKTPRFRTARECAEMDLQLTNALKLQLLLDGEPRLDFQMMTCPIDFGNRRYQFPLPPETRAGLVTAHITALISRARVAIGEHQLLVLARAEELIKQELSAITGSSQSRFCTDLLAARADLLVAYSDAQGRNGKLLQQAWRMYEHAVTVTSGRVRERFQTCLRWAGQAKDRGYTSDAFRAYSSAITLLPNLVSLSEDVFGRIEALRLVSGLAASSIALALDLGEHTAAVDFMEQTRGILWLQFSQIQGHDLESVPDSLRDVFGDVIRELATGDHQQWTARRRKVEELKRITAKIRAFPHLERFLLPPRLYDIGSAVYDRDGYAIVLIPSTTHCDVMVLGHAEGHSHLRLKTLNMAYLRSMSHGIGKDCFRARQGQVNATTLRRIRPVPVTSVSLTLTDATLPLLAELWTVLVRPILEHLDILSHPKHEARKRVWWCPVGVLSSLPIHAAGIYDGPNQDNIGNYFVSSYTPTLTALHRLLTKPAKQGHLNPIQTPSTVLLVAQADVPNQPSLPQAQVEVDLVRSLLLPGCVANNSAVSDMSVDTVMKGVAGANVVHFACHGHQDQENPLKSGFEMRDGRLTLGQLMQLEIPHAQLAYLSACQSAGMDESRPDENLNLVGAMILVGFKSVIGTMWSMDDADGPFMAQRIYKQIFRGGVLDLDDVAYAVDTAVGELRASGAPASRWATYVHFGL